ncbi:MAG: GntR family transcriptional regulator [Victivallales bacterium]|jgi:DNA-binding transcriptional regulator YhcF (GntR family)|nr:GntR family transcriptional regulator [Victivallales bacterium]
MKLLQHQTKKQQVLTALEKDIYEGTLKPGDRMRGIRAIAEEFGVSTIVIKEAYKVLEKNGLIQISPKRGVFVNPGFIRDKTRVVVLLTDASQENIEHYYESLFLSASECNVYVITVLVKKEEIEKQISQVREKNPDLILIDVEARFYSYQQLESLLFGVHHRYVRRWEWDGEIPSDSVLSDFTGTYIRALNYLKSNGHSKILVLGYQEHVQNFRLNSFVECEKATGMSFGKELIYYAAGECMKQNPEELIRLYQKERPTAIMGVSDYLLYKVYMYAEYNCPALCTLERIGVFDLHFSRIPGMEHSSIPFNFSDLWYKAFANSYYQAPVFIPVCEIIHRQQANRRV